jgi:hypothetical protein
MNKMVSLTLLLVMCTAYICYAQVDTVLQSVQQLPGKNIASVTSNTNQYTTLVTEKISGQDSVAKGLQQAPAKYATNINGNVNKYNGSINKRTTQADSTAKSLQQVPAKYIKNVDNKIDKYDARINKRTEKTLQRLSKWENKIQPVLQKADPQAAQKLFGDGQMTFTTLLQKYESGEALTSQYQAQYNTYNDKVTTQLKYLDQQKGKLDSNLVKPVSDANAKMTQLNKDEDNDAAIQQFIQQRRTQLQAAVIQSIGNSPYLGKINQESFYYVQTMKNYKEIFSDPQVAEKTATDIINKIPAYQNFLVRNSQLASLFGLSSGGSAMSDSANASLDSASLAGLQTKASVQSQLQDKIATGGPNAQQEMSQSMQAAQAQITQFKSQLNQMGNSAGGSSSTSAAPGFTPNMQKTKTFLQRLEFGTNFQTTNSNGYFPVTTDVGFSLGYKLSDKATIGVGASYNIGWGTGITHISISGQGVGLRSFLDLKLKGSLWASGGFEMNYQSEFSNIKALNNYSAWQQSGLIGLSKKYKVGKQNCNMQVLWDFLSYEQVPRTSPIVFRTGYSF